MRLYSDVLSRLDVTAEFTTLLKVLDDLAEGRPLSKPEAYAGGLLQRAPEIFNQLRHQNGLGDALSLALAQDKEFQENHRRFPDFTSDIDGIVSMYVDNFKDCFPALYLGIEIAPYAQAMQLTESLLRAA